MKRIQVSMVASAMETECKATSAESVIEAIRSGRWQNAIGLIRSTYADAEARGVSPKKAVTELKRSLPGILWSGTFGRRQSDAIEQHSGLLVADLDDLTPEVIASTRLALVSDPHVCVVFLSPTGTGLKAVFRVPADVSRHGEAFRAVAFRVREICGIEVDASGKDVARLCFVSHDPEARWNDGAVELVVNVPASLGTPMNTQVAADNPTPRIAARRQISEELLGPINWSGESSGLCQCPGKDRHTTGDGKRDCQVLLDGVPTITCFHNSCRDVLLEKNRTLRSLIARVEGNSSACRVGVENTSPDELPPAIVKAWPEPISAAGHFGLAGEFVRTLEPHTEADLNAVLVLFLAAFGSMVGGGPHFRAQGSRHTCRIWPVIVGGTAGGRKGSAWSSVLQVLRRVDEGWSRNRVASGLASGEGLIWAVRDPMKKAGKRARDGEGQEFEDPGETDKRLFVVEAEFSSVLKVAAREGNTLSDLLRKAWDTDDLRNLTKNAPVRATGAHITLQGQITKADLTKHLEETDALNGFGNRFLWLVVRRSKMLPFGGDLEHEDLSELIRRIQLALDHARKSANIQFSDKARPFWASTYATLSAERHGLFGTLTQRAEAQVVRLALIYALLDRAHAIEISHIQSALAVWEYCERSTAYIFGDSVGDKTADRILEALQSAGVGGMTGTELHHLFKKNETSQRIANALGLLEKMRKVRSTKDQPGVQGGRPSTRWHVANETNERTPTTDIEPSPDVTNETNEPPQPRG